MGDIKKQSYKKVLDINNKHITKSYEILRKKFLQNNL